jgi:hypothetical protein
MLLPHPAGLRLAACWTRELLHGELPEHPRVLLLAAPALNSSMLVSVARTGTQAATSTSKQGRPALMTAPAPAHHLRAPAPAPAHHLRAPAPALRSLGE